MRHYYSTGRMAAARIRLADARPLRDGDSAQYPPGTYTAEVVSSFRDGSVRVRGAGGRELVIRRPGRRAPPAGSRVRIQVSLVGDVDVLVVPGTGEAFVVDSSGALRHEAPTAREAVQWVMSNRLRLVQPVGRLA